MPKKRSECNCNCHKPKVNVVHIIACCVPDNQFKDEQSSDGGRVKHG